MRKRLVSVVIPNWNGRYFLQTCLSSLKRQTYQNHEICIVDNASIDGSQAFIRQHYPDINLIELPENRGFTGACNIGMSAAQGEFIALLNNDTEADENWLYAVVDAFERHPEAGMIASKMLLFDQRNYIHTAGDYFTINGRAGNRGVWQRDEGQFDSEVYVFSACGGASIYRKQLLQQIGLLDEDFFFSLEDIDLAWRAQLVGWRCLYTPSAIVYHHLSATGGGVTASFHDGRNLIYVLLKNYPMALWRKNAILILHTQWKMAWDALKAWRGAAAKARLRGMLAGIRGIPKMLQKRKMIQRSRTVSIEIIEAILSPPE